MKTEELQKWLKDKSVKRWKRVLLFMYDEGGPMSFDEIAENIGADRVGIYRLMKKLEVANWVVKSKEKPKKWILTNFGEESLFSLQKIGRIPKRDRE